MNPSPESRSSPYLAGTSAAARAFEGELGRLASSDVTVLLEGESGVGKGAAARRLHARGARAGAPVVEVGLGALAPTLLEAELFGHEEGAFTGAARARPGRFRAAAGGTIVLDGVETLPEDLQVKLLRVLQERVVEPLGAEAPVSVDARVVATSGRDLRVEVAAGRFREDLYYRLAVAVLRVPPLRARREDLPALAAWLVDRVAARLRVAPRPFSPAALDCLAAHSWPGNVRELENAVERILALAPAGEPAGEPAPVGAEELTFLTEPIPGEARRLARAALGLGLGLDDLTGTLIEEALAENRGNASAAARQLGLTRRAFDYRRRRGAGGES
ncbi:MAG: sigma-54-dependent Fis family transcriptional regulator [Planctomycetes bacterium]|nr:sigma-54-dependent Fis family transcriptional regulator [Planctomycetota bacterium]